MTAHHVALAILTFGAALGMILAGVVLEVVSARQRRKARLHNEAMRSRIAARTQRRTR